MKTYRFILNDELHHHGIEGQKWGIRNGPPYPLDEQSHSVRERKAKNKNSSQKEEKTSNTKANTKTKSNLKAAAVLTAGLLAAGGSYYLLKTGAAKDLLESGKSIVNSLLPGVGDKGSLDVVRFLQKNKLGDTKLTISKRKMISNINSKYRNGSILEPGGQNNCLHCSTAYILNTLFGYNVSASPTNKPFGNIDEISGLYMNRDEKLPLRIFDGIKFFDYSFDGVKDNTAFETNKREKMRPTFIEAFSKIQNGSTGMVTIKGHIMNYEKDSKGKVLIIDSQSNIIDTIDNVSSRLKVYGIYDFSNASIRADAVDILKLLVT